MKRAVQFSMNFVQKEAPEEERQGSWAKSHTAKHHEGAKTNGSQRNGNTGQDNSQQEVNNWPRISGGVSQTGLIDVVRVQPQESSMNSAYNCIVDKENGYNSKENGEEVDSPVDVSAEEERQQQRMRAFSAQRLPAPESGMMHLTPFLLATNVCDSDSDVIKGLAKEIIDVGASPFTAACAVRRYIRNNITYVLHPKDMKASETATCKEGMCTNKANLQIALLRAAGIPAGTSHPASLRNIFEAAITL